MTESFLDSNLYSKVGVLAYDENMIGGRAGAKILKLNTTQYLNASSSLLLLLLCVQLLLTTGSA